MEKTYIVTGASSGLGKESAALLARLGANVVMLCRNEEKGQLALKEIVQRSSNPKIDLIIADLSKSDSLTKFAEEFTRRHDRLHGLLCCAGVRTYDRRISCDGLEVMFATEYLGHFSLTNLLLPALISGSPARVVTVAGQVDFEQDFEALQRLAFSAAEGGMVCNAIDPAKKVALAKILFSSELSRRVNLLGITSNSVFPGFTRTNLLHNYPWYARLLDRALKGTKELQTPGEGAKFLVDLVSDKRYEGVSGKHFALNEIDRAFKDQHWVEPAANLWSFSEALVGRQLVYC
jgi:NAD(P)-dependent dehydrogenase (short-subunit alcohol dehydrogenase family)